MAWPSSKTGKRTPAKSGAKKTVHKSASHPLVRVKQVGRQWVVTLGGQPITKPDTKAVITKKAADLRAKAKKNPGTLSVTKCKQLIALDARRRGREKPPTITDYRDNPGVSRVPIADILRSNGEQTIAATIAEMKKKAGGKIPAWKKFKPVALTRSAGGKYIITDGFHRTALSIMHKRKTIDAKVRNSNPANGDPKAQAAFDAAVARLKNKTASVRDITDAVKLGAKAGFSQDEVWRLIRKTWNAAAKKAPKRNPGVLGALETLSTLAMGTSALLDVQKQLRPAKRKKAAAKKPAGKSGAKPAVRKSSPPKKNSGETAAELNEQIRSLKKHLRSKTSADNRRRLQATIETLTKKRDRLKKQKKNGVISRWAGRRAAAKELKKELLLKAKLERVQKRKAAAKRKALQTNSGTVSLRTLRAEYARQMHSGTTTGKATAREIAKMIREREAKRPKKNHGSSRPFEKFQGRRSTEILDLYVPDGTPPTGTWVLGKLFELRIRGWGRIDVEDSHYYLIGNKANSQMYIGYDLRRGKKTIFTPEPGLADGFTLPVGKLTHVVYETVKTHLGDELHDPTPYIHRMGEEGGEEPMLTRDNKGFAHIENGSYEITPLGIRN